MAMGSFSNVSANRWPSHANFARCISPIDRVAHRVVGLAGHHYTNKCQVMPWCLLHLQEYGSGRADLGLPPLDPEAEGPLRGGGVPKLRDYLAFGQLMGEKPEEVQRQLQLNNMAVEVDEESLEMLSE